MHVNLCYFTETGNVPDEVHKFCVGIGMGLDFLFKSVLNLCHDFLCLLYGCNIFNLYKLKDHKTINNICSLTITCSESKCESPCLFARSDHSIQTGLTNPLI